MNCTIQVEHEVTAKEITPCGDYGILRGETCHCTALRKGPRCEDHKDLGAFKILGKVQRDFKGAVTMSKQGLAGKKNLRVFLPGRLRLPRQV